MKLPVTIDPRYHDAVIFDLDGVVTDTASIHAAAWRTMFDDYLAGRPAREGEDHSPFTDDDYRRFVDGKPRYDGVADFLASRGIVVPHGNPSDSGDTTVCGLGNRKQQVFLELMAGGVPRFDSTVALVRKLQEAGVATAIYSSSRNCEQVLRAAGIGDLFAVRVDGVVADASGAAGQTRPRRPARSHPQTGCTPGALGRRRGRRAPGWRPAGTAGSHSSSASTGPAMPTSCCVAAPTSWSPTWPRSRSAPVTDPCRGCRTRWIPMAS